jgi:hypothetical protein
MIDLADEEDAEDAPQSREIKRQKRMSPEVEETRLNDDSCLNGTCECSSGFVLKVSI